MKSISDDEMIKTSRGRKRIGGLFTKHDSLRAVNAELLAALESVLTIGGIDQSPGTNGRVVLHQVRAAIARARP